MPNSQKIKVSFVEKLTENLLQGILQVFSEHEEQLAFLSVDKTLTFFSPQPVFMLKPEVENYKVVNRHVEHENDYRHYTYYFQLIDEIENSGSESLNPEMLKSNTDNYERFLEDEPVMFFSSDLLTTVEEDLKLYTLGEDIFDLFLIRKKASFHE